MISLLVLLVASTVAPPIGALWPDEEPSTELENIQEVWNALTGDDPNPPDWAKPVLHAVQESSSFTIIRFKRNPQQPNHGSRGIHPLLRKFDPNTFNRIKQINAVGNNRHLLYQLYVGLVYMFNPRSIPGAMRRKRNPYNNRAIHPLLQRFDRNTFNKIKQLNPAGNNKRLLYQLYVGLVYMFNPAIIPGYARGASSYAASSASSYADRSASSYAARSAAARSASSYAARRVSARSAASYAGRSASSARRASSYPARTPYAAASAAKSAASSAARSASVARRHAAAAARSALSAKSASPYAARRASSARSGSSYPERTPYGAASVAESAASSAARSASAARKHAAAAARSALSVQSASSYADRSASSYAARSASSYADRSASASSPYGTVVQHGGTTKRYPGGGSGVLVNVGSNG